MTFATGGPSRSRTAELADAQRLACRCCRGPRFAILSAGFGLLIAWAIVRESPVPVPQRKQRLAWFLGAPTASAIAWFAYFQIIYGTPNPAAPYGQRPETSWAFVPGGLAGLLFDQQFGLLMYAPVLAVAAFGLSAGSPGPSRHVARAVSIVSVLYLCVVATYWMWWAGVPATPARFAAVVLPGLAVPLALAWDRAGAVARALFATLLVVSVGITAIPPWRSAAIAASTSLTRAVVPPRRGRVRRGRG